MKPDLVTTATELFEAAKNQNLYAALVSQVIKDFKLASMSSLDELPQDLPAQQLLETVNATIYTLLQTDATSCLNLLYIVDVPEQVIKELQSDTLEKASKDISFLILKRCWLKVWYKSHY